MFFKETLVMRDLSLSEGQTVTFEQTDPYPVRVSLQQPKKGEGLKGMESGDCTCLVETELDVSTKVSEQFAKAVNAAKEFTPQVVNGIPTQPPKPPTAVMDFTVQAGRRMTDFVCRVARLIRWRTGIPDHHNPIRHTKGMCWSIDGQTWERTPWELEIKLHVGVSYSDLSEELVQSVREMLSRGVSEPLARELLLEAISLQHSNPRSALLIGVAAAEIGFKELIAQLIPEAEWLAFHVPSPPLVTMLEEYLPTLPVKLKLSGQECPDPFVPPELLQTLRKGIKLRNEVVHAGASISHDTLDEVLKTVNDLLYLLDVYSGQGWALRRVSYKGQMILKETLDLPSNPKKGK